MQQKWFVGTSGYSYSNWRGINGFYENIKLKDELNYYSSLYNFVEINSSFYREPSIETLIKWKRNVPNYFKFSLKVHRYFTHMKRLNIDEEFKARWKVFWIKCLALKPKLGALLFQLPPMKLTSSMLLQLHELSTILPKNQKIVFECRDKSWDCEEIEKLFSKHNWAFCIIHVNNEKGWAGNLESGFFPTNPKLWVTANWGSYFRFHGSAGQYFGSYNPNVLKNVILQILHLQNKPKTNFFAFNNTNEAGQLSSATTNASALSILITTLGSDQSC